MSPIKGLVPLAFALAAFGGAAAPGWAQDASPSPSAAPAMVTKQPTLLDQEYDGRYHWKVTPYVWMPSINGNFRYVVPSVPKLGAPAGTAALNVQVGPNQYLSKLNFAFMGAFDVRKGAVAFFGDYINLNLSNGSTFVTTISGPGGKLALPINLGTSSRITSTIWEAAAAYTVARGHNANLEVFGGWRQAALRATLDWNLVLGKGAIVNRSGNVERRYALSDVIFGLRGKAFLGDGRWFVPYYIDVGSGYNNQSWQGYTGIGRATRNGALLLAFRSLSFDALPQNALVQKLRIGGPLLGYTLNL